MSSRRLRSKYGRLRDKAQQIIWGASTDQLLAKDWLSEEDKKREDAKVEVISDKRVVYRYDAARRLSDTVNRAEDNHVVRFPFRITDSPDIEDGTFRLAREVIFRVIGLDGRAVTWIAILDIRTGVLLYLRPFLADVNGLVFIRDPLTAGGSAGPDSTAGTLDVFRNSVALPGLTAPAPGTQQVLSGENVAIQDFEPFTAAPPTQPIGTDFDYGSRTNDFAAVNAYYHNDRFFRLVSELGFVNFFKGTALPVPVDHRGRYGNPGRDRDQCLLLG